MNAFNLWAIDLCEINDNFVEHSQDSASTANHAMSTKFSNENESTESTASKLRKWHIWISNYFCPLNNWVRPRRLVFAACIYSAHLRKRMTKSQLLWWISFRMFQLTHTVPIAHFALNKILWVRKMWRWCHSLIHSFVHWLISVFRGNWNEVACAQAAAKLFSKVLSLLPR